MERGVFSKLLAFSFLYVLLYSESTTGPGRHLAAGDMSPGLSVLLLALQAQESALCGFASQLLLLRNPTKLLGSDPGVPGVPFQTRCVSSLYSAP